MGSWILRVHVAVVAFAAGTAASLIWDSLQRPYVLWGRARPSATASSSPVRASEKRRCAVGRRAVEEALEGHRRQPIGCVRAIAAVKAEVEGAEVSTIAEPVYPPEAARAGVSGTVKVHAVSNHWGTVIAAHAFSGDPLLREAAVEAACRSRFRPNFGRDAFEDTLTFDFVLP